MQYVARQGRSGNRMQPLSSTQAWLEASIQW